MISSWDDPLRQLAREAALPHHQNTVRHLQQLRQFGTDHQNRRAGSRQAIHHFEHFHLRANVDASCRLIEQEHFRAARQPFRDHDLLLIAAAQPARQLAPDEHLMRNLPTYSLVTCVLCAVMQHAPRAEPTQARCGHVIRNRQLSREPDRAPGLPVSARFPRPTA